MTSLRLALVVGQLQRGGAERQLFELATRLDRERFDPLVICLSEVTEPYGPRLKAAGVEVLALPRRGHRDAGRVRSLARLLRERRIDLAHSFLIAANAYLWAATRLAGGPPYIASSRTCIPPKGRVALWVHRRAFRGAAAVVANARAVAEFTCRLYGLAEDRVMVIPNGVDLRPYDEAAGDSGARAAVRESLGFGAAEVVAALVGRLSPEKRFDLLIAAAGMARGGDGAAVRFVLVGDGPSRESLRSAIDRAGLGEVVRMAGARDDIARVLSACDLFVQTSDTEGLPNAVMEAMASGLPVVATRAGGTIELVEEGKTGLTVPCGDPAALAAAIGALARDAGLRSGMGERGRAQIAGSYSVERMVEATAALYATVAR